jgi:hypothetical protein
MNLGHTLLLSRAGLLTLLVLCLGGSEMDALPVEKRGTASRTAQCIPNVRARDDSHWVCLPRTIPVVKEAC